MQLRFIAAITVYAASYLPLTLILLVQDISLSSLNTGVCKHLQNFAHECDIPIQHPLLAIPPVFVTALCFGVSALFIRTLRSDANIEIGSAKHIPADLMNYVLPYIVSFMGLDYGSPNKLGGFVVFFAWMYIINYRSGRVIMNPILIVFGWRFYEIIYRYEGGSAKVYTGVALSRVELESGKICRQATFQDVMIVKRDGGDGSIAGSA